jgi:hypothetical protein
MQNTNPFSFFDFSYFSPARLQMLYVQFLANFPVNVQPFVSIALAVLIVYVVYRIIRKDWIFLIALVILVPASLPVLKSIWAGVVTVVKFLFHFGN